MGLPVREVSFNGEEKKASQYVQWDSILYKPDLFPPMNHEHDDLYYTKSEIDDLIGDGVGGGGVQEVTWEIIKNKPSSFTPSAHTHDDKYYTEAEINSQMSGKANTSHTHDDRYYTESEVNSRLYTKSNTDHTHSNYYTVGDLDNAVVGLSISGNKLIATRKNGTTLELQLPSGGGGGVQEKFQISVDEAVATVVNNQFTFKKDGTLVVRYLEACDITLTISSAGTGYYMLTTLLSGVSSTVTWNRDLKSYTYTGKVNDTISLRTDSANWVGKIE